MEQNLPLVERHYPGLRSPEGWVIIGRSSGLTDFEKRRLLRRNINMRGRITIRTYDDLIEEAKAYVRSVERALGLT